MKSTWGCALIAAVILFYSHLFMYAKGAMTVRKDACYEWCDKTKFESVGGFKYCREVCDEN